MRVHIYTEYIYAHHLHVGLDIHPIEKFRNIFLVNADCDDVEHPVHDSFSVLQYVAVFCSVLQRVEVWLPSAPIKMMLSTLCLTHSVCCSVLRCVAVCCSVLHSMLQCVSVCCRMLQCVAVCCSVLQCVAMCCNELQCADADCDDVKHPVHNSFSVLQRVAVCCSVLQCVAVCYSVLQ